MEQKYKKIFFVGIGGIGMSALARQSLARGAEVFGSDIAESEVTRALCDSGITVSIGQSIEIIPLDTELIVYSNAIKKLDDGFFEKLKSLEIPLKSYPELLGEVSRGMHTIAIAGAHGKTTTTAMVGTVLKDLGQDPTIVVGSILVREKTNFVAGKSDLFVTEADEYQRAFHNLYPSILVITNIDRDHLDYYKDLAEIQGAFRELALRVPSEGAIVCDPKDPNVISVLDGASARIIDYTTVGIVGLTLSFPGRHNVENAQAALGVVAALGLDPVRAIGSLNEFAGTWRRFERRGEMKTGAIIYDDYAHNPAKVRAALAGARELYPDRRLIAVFQPHLYSRTKSLLEEFGRAFGEADQVIITPIYAAREMDDPEISAELLAKEIEKNARPVKVLSDPATLKQFLDTETDTKTIVLMLGAGDINTWTPHLLS